MNKKDITIKMANDAGITIFQAEKAFNTLFKGIKESLIKGQRVTFSSFGSFEIKNRKAETPKQEKL